VTHSIASAIRAGSLRLAGAGVPDPARDARLLAAEALGLAPDRLSLVASGPLPEPAAARLEAMLDDRCRRRPMAQILGRRAFWGRDFTVTAAVLDPRPETETLIACALDGPAPARILDLGVGSGAILVTLLAEWSGASGVGVDASAAALAVAEANAARHGVADRARFALSDWGSAVTGVFDLVVANPPYIPAGELDALAPEVRDWEPALALSPGPDGCAAYGRIAADLGRLLAPGGRALFEIGAGQGEAVVAIMTRAGFSNVRLHADLDGRARVVAVERR
jgi:release factor glutamine methyltransferase